MFGLFDLFGFGQSAKEAARELRDAMQEREEWMREHPEHQRYFDVVFEHWPEDEASQQYWLAQANARPGATPFFTKRVGRGWRGRVKGIYLAFDAADQLEPAA